MSEELVMEKCLCKTTWDEYQFLTSGYPNRNDKRKLFESTDGMWATDFLHDLKDGDADLAFYHGDTPNPRQGIKVDMHISREPKDGYREMWVFGFVGRSRCITQYKPQDVSRGIDCNKADIKHGSVYVDLWCERDYFPDMPEGAVFPIYVKITRKEEDHAK